MKVTWKKKNKRGLPAALSLFEPNSQSNNDATTQHDCDDGTPKSTQLAMQFQAQGDNLAMVFFFFFFCVVKNGNRL